MAIGINFDNDASYREADYWHVEVLPEYVYAIFEGNWLIAIVSEYTYSLNQDEYEEYGYTCRKINFNCIPHKQVIKFI